MKRYLALYKNYVLAVLQSTMQYKVSFLLMVIGRFLVAFSGLLGVAFIFSGFTDIKGYTYGDILLCFSIIQLSFYLAECIGSGFLGFSNTIKKGTFDRILVRPCSPILQVLGSRFEIGRIGPLISALIMLILGIRQHPMVLNPIRLLTLFLMIAGGFLLFMGLFLLGAAICFFSVEESSCLNILTYGGKEHGKYPMDVYGKGLFRFCTYVIPYTLVQYYPLQYLTGKSDCILYAFFPLGTLLFFFLCYAFWRFGIAHYTSCGS